MATATATSSLLLHPSPLSRRTAVSTSSLPSRRHSLLLLLSLPAPFLAVTAPPSRAADIGFFGIRKRDLVKLEQEAVEVVKEGEEAVEKEIESAAAAVAAEAGGAGAGLPIAGDLVQAGAVAGAEAVGVLVGLSVVNGILGTETEK
ncbi:hypothetical protein FCM35_KLT09951 [Carex littledalei]|uniref:Uncharacterized protein n=1 Tax=Carex littledalei TaxID=544730 RepID=A0A833RKD0_9POAL|nr:hypothetical protein FCM35_KLT09951 [Carex littledalei]